MAVQSTHTDFAHMGVGRKASAGQSLPKPTPATWFWYLYVDANTPGDYATAFAQGPESFSGADYWTGATLADGNMSCGMNGADFEGPAIITGRWLRQSLVTWRDSVDTYQDYYYDLPDLSKVIHSSGALRPSPSPDPNYFLANGSTTFFRFLDVEWASNETLAGRMLAGKCYQAKFSGPACAAEAMSPFPVLEQYRPLLWGCWPLRTKGDRFDISGFGRHLYESGDPLVSLGNPPYVDAPIGEDYEFMVLLAGAAAAGGGTQALTLNGYAAPGVYGASATVPGAVAVSLNALVAQGIYGALALTTNTPITLNPIVAQAIFGSATYTPGSVSVAPATVIGQAIFGAFAASTAGTQSINPDPVVAQGVGGTLALTPGAVAISVGDLVAQGVAGSFTVTPGSVAVSFSGFGAQGVPGPIQISYVITAGGIVAKASMGGLAVNVGAVSIVPGGIVAQSEFGPILVTIPGGTANLIYQAQLWIGMGIGI